MWTSTDFKIYLKRYTYIDSYFLSNRLTYENEYSRVLEIDGIVFMNMVETSGEMIDENQEFQALICEGDGIYDCALGDWMAIRQIGELVFFIPCLEKIAISKSLELHAPPKYLSDRGAFWLDKNDFSKLIKKLPGFKEFSSIKQLSLDELIWLYKWEAPKGLFGHYPHYDRFNDELIVDVSFLNIEMIVEIIEIKLGELKKFSKFKLEPFDQKDRVISIYIEGKDLKPWEGLCVSDDKYYLIYGDFKIITFD